MREFPKLEFNLSFFIDFWRDFDESLFCSREGHLHLTESSNRIQHKNMFTQNLQNRLCQVKDINIFLPTWNFVKSESIGISCVVFPWSLRFCQLL